MGNKIDSINEKRVRIHAYYLPQFHPIPENDKWWGKGFTEWTNVAKAKPLFKGHWQPRLPADLGFYDLRVPEVREAQAEMAREHGIEGFCYYHYWFGDGRQLLERPFNEVLSSGKPDFPFSLCWANGSWTGIWFGETDKTLIEQTYPGRQDYIKHFRHLLPAFSDDRYVTIDGKPVFQIHIPRLLPNQREFTDIFREEAHKAGFPGIYLLAGYSNPDDWNPKEHGFDGVVADKFSHALIKLRSLKVRISDITDHLINRANLRSLFGRSIIETSIINYSDLINEMNYAENKPYDYFPLVIPNWDNTPRSGHRGTVVTSSTPELFKTHLSNAIDFTFNSDKTNLFVFIKSWNEWAEGNYLEPDSVFGKLYLQVIKELTLD